MVRISLDRILDAPAMERIHDALGTKTVADSSRDTKLLCMQRFVRMFAYGASALILVLYLSSLGVSDARIGLFMTLTLLGDVAISFVLTLFADGLGRRNILLLGSLLMAISGFIFALTDNFWVLLAASMVGVISPSGNEIGPFRAIEESTLSQLVHKDLRSDVFAWYNLIGTAGAAAGQILCGWLVQSLVTSGEFEPRAAYRFIFVIYGIAGFGKLALTLALSDACEAVKEPEPAQEFDELENEVEGLLSDVEEEDESDEAIQIRSGKSRPRSPSPLPPSSKQKRLRTLMPKISSESRAILIKLCLLFAIDSFASGLVTSSWQTYYFTTKFSLTAGFLGTIFFCASIVAAASNLVAARIAKAIGLVKTMVFTHLPSAVFLALIPLPSNVWFAVMFLILRSCTSTMDQAPRQAFLAAAVLPSERTAVMGFVNVVKTLSQSGGPLTTGVLAGMGQMWFSFILAGTLKASYDLMMLKMFLGFQGRE